MRLAILLVLLAPSCARAATAPADTFETHAVKDRAETTAYFKTDPMSPLAAIRREDIRRGAAITIGSAVGNDVVLADTSVAAHHLKVRVEGAGFRVESLDPGATFTVKGESKRDAVLPPGTIGVGRYRVRLSYQNAPAVIVFDPANIAAGATGPTWYPYDARYRFTVPLVKEAKADTVRIESTHGQPRPALRVGRFTLPLPGGSVRLAAYRLLEPGVGDTDLSLFFMDATNGKGSYHGGRYVDVVAQPGGRYLVDLNMSYSPSCAYSPYYNCPIPPLENRLSARIPAGESYAAEAH
jgi:uncharacterized protein (DUF1684 family)